MKTELFRAEKLFFRPPMTNKTDHRFLRAISRKRQKTKASTKDERRCNDGYTVITGAKADRATGANMSIGSQETLPPKGINSRLAIAFITLLIIVGVEPFHARAGELPAPQESLNLKSFIFDMPMNPGVSDPKPRWKFVVPRGDPVHPDTQRPKDTPGYSPPKGDPGAPEWIAELLERNQPKEFVYDPGDPMYEFDPHSMSEADFYAAMEWRKIIASDLATLDEDHEKIRKEVEDKRQKDQERIDREREAQLRKEEAETKRREKKLKAQAEEEREQAAARARERKSLEIKAYRKEEEYERIARESEKAKAAARAEQQKADKAAENAELLKKAAETTAEQEERIEKRMASNRAKGLATTSRELRGEATKKASEARITASENLAKKAELEAQTARRNAEILNRQAIENRNELARIKIAAEDAKDREIYANKKNAYYSKLAKSEAHAQGERDRIISTVSEISNEVGGLLVINSTYRLPPKSVENDYPLPTHGVTDFNMTSIGHASGAVDITFVNISKGMAETVLRETIDRLGYGYFGMFEEVFNDPSQVEGKAQYNTYFYARRDPTPRMKQSKVKASGTHIHIAPCLPSNNCPPPRRPPGLIDNPL